MSDATEQLSAMIASLGWTMTATPRQPTKQEAADDKKTGSAMLRYSVALVSKEGHEILRTPYSCGLAFPERWFWHDLSDFQRADLCRSAGCGPNPPHRKGFMSARNQTVFERDLTNIIHARWKPSIVDVVAALAMDCAHVEPYLPDQFEAWASDLGDNPDSIRAREGFYAIVRNRDALRGSMDAPTFAALCKLGTEL